MFRMLTNKQIATFKTGDRVYEMKIERRCDGKAHIILKEVFVNKEPVLIFNKYEQAKSIGEKDIAVYQALEDFYPAVIVEEIDED